MKINDKENLPGKSNDVNLKNFNLKKRKINKANERKEKLSKIKNFKKI